MEIKFLVLVGMLSFHIAHDFNQGMMANLKQRSWWMRQEGYGPKYSCDFIVALLAHSFLWSCIIMVPIVVCRWPDIQSWYFVVIAANTLIHAVVDDQKANRLTLNLVEDQLAHLVQILLTWAIFIVHMN